MGSISPNQTMAEEKYIFCARYKPIVF